MDRLRELLEIDQNKEMHYSARKTLAANMETEIEIYAFSIEEALQTAAEELMTSIVNLHYEILEKGSSGILGIGKKPYRILIKKVGDIGESGPDEGLGLDFSMPSEIIANLDGTFKLLVKKEGVMLKVNPPKGSGKPVNYEMVEQKVMKKELPQFDSNAIKREIQRTSGKWVKISDYIPSPYDSTFQIQVSPDEMKAFITINKPDKFGRVLETEEVVAGLKSKNVFFGIKDKVIAESIENELYGMPLLVAEGDIPVEGRDADIKYHFKTSTDDVKFAMADDGTIDFHKLDIFQSVVVGQVLASKMLPTRGKAGKTVTGRVIPARDGKDMKLLPGKNCHISEDGLQIISDINGQVVFKNGRINVEPILEITGDVDLTTGDINFPGNVIIFGNVKDTFKVYSGGNIEVKGNIEKAEVVAEGNIIVRQGIQGKDEARVTCGGDIFARFIERANLNIGSDAIITEVLLHSNVDCKGSIICTGGKRSQVAGGTVRALREINAKFLGAEAYTETTLEVGIDPEIEDKLVEANRRKDEINKLMPDITKQLNNLSMMMATGPLPPDKEDVFNELSIKNMEFREELDSIEEQVGEIHKYLEELGKDAKISASKITFPGVKIKIKNAVLIVKSEYKFVTFFKDGPNIKIVPYEKPKEIDEKLANLTKRKSFG